MVDCVCLIMLKYLNACFYGYLFGLIILLIDCEDLVEFNRKKDEFPMHVAARNQRRIS